MLLVRLAAWRFLWRMRLARRGRLGPARARMRWPRRLGRLRLTRGVGLGARLVRVRLADGRACSAAHAHVRGAAGGRVGVGGDGLAGLAVGGRRCRTAAHVAHASVDGHVGGCAAEFAGIARTRDGAAAETVRARFRGAGDGVVAVTLGA